MNASLVKHGTTLSNMQMMSQGSHVNILVVNVKPSLFSNALLNYATPIIITEALHLADAQWLNL